MTARIGLVVAAALYALACTAELPEPQSRGARLYAARCNGGCHRLFAPGSLKYPMWEMQVDLMQGEMARRGIPPLTPQERTVVLEYLKRHSG